MSGDACVVAETVAQRSTAVLLSFSLQSNQADLVASGFSAHRRTVHHLCHADSSNDSVSCAYCPSSGSFSVLLRATVTLRTIIRSSILRGYRTLRKLRKNGMLRQ